MNLVTEKCSKSTILVNELQYWFSPANAWKQCRWPGSEVGANAAWSKPWSPAFPSATVQRCKGHMLSSRNQTCFYSLDWKKKKKAYSCFCTSWELKRVRAWCPIWHTKPTQPHCIDRSFLGISPKNPSCWGTVLWHKEIGITENIERGQCLYGWFIP